MNTKPFFITTPIYYVNDKPHIGHAYTSIACDVLARFKRLDGYDVFFLTGTDEHGQKVANSAEAAGVTPQLFADKVSQNFRDMMKKLNISNDDFIRTTEERHRQACQELWRRLYANGAIYRGTYAGWYAVRDESFYDVSELTSDAAGVKIAPSGAPCEWVEEPSWFFRLSEWGDKLLAFYDEHPDFIRPKSRRNEVTSFVRAGVRDLSISRAGLSWGVPVPDDPDGHVMYVWFDALINYMTAIGWPHNSKMADHFWPADIHMVGKDILRFHAVYWPAFLLAAGIKPPKHIVAHGWWTNEGQKISKSLGNVIVPDDLINAYGLDQMRYFLLREVPFGQDGDFSHEAVLRRINSDLANGLGNMAQRVLAMVQKNCSGARHALDNLLAEDREIIDAAHGLVNTVRELLNEPAFHRALDAIWHVIALTDRYLANTAPWSLAKTDKPRMETVLATALEVLRHVAVLLQPFMPQAMAALLDQLGVPLLARDIASLNATPRAGEILPKPTGLFPRIDKSE